ncbi:terminase large subunit [Caulobacter phage CcrColossus]|uniref:Intein-containing putative terminase large subunit n=2 Tax=Caulobacter phage CcrColossus TaxID=1211640 RepID=K4JWN2_9CAUD|nr:terminase large subunit [Caulobacter phage CcrColossus]AFU88318.1 intein-containing putative terminase large subunit precursor [Caulobacter phage CcrColossus]
MTSTNVPAPYPMEQRKRTRAAITQLNDLAHKSLEVAQMGLILPTTTKQAIIKITGTSDPSQQVEALNDLSEKVQKHHLERLLPLAKDEFNAFCEYVNPDEPPESPWHMWLVDKLQEIENNPRLNRFILNCPPGHAKPLHVDTLVRMGDGSWKRLGDIKKGDFVLSHVGLSRAVTAVHDQGVLPLLKITTRRGREILSAHDHSFLSKGKWKQAVDLRPGDPLEIVGAVTPQTTKAADPYPDLTEANYRLAAWVVARMYRIHKKDFHEYSFSVSLAGHQTALENLLTQHAIPFTNYPRAQAGRSYHRLGTKAIKAFLARFDLDVPTEERCIPEKVFSATYAKRKVFTQAYIQVRGTFSGKKTPLVRFNYTTEKHARDWQRLLASMGVDSSLTIRERSFRVTISAPGLRVLEEQEISFPGEEHETYLSKRAEAIKPLSDSVASVEPAGEGPCKCLTVNQDHTFLADGVVVHNSTYASRLFVAWRLGRNPKLRIIGGGNSQTFVENEFSKKIRNLVTTPMYGKVFPSLAIDPSTRGAPQWAIAGTTGQYAAKGVGSPVHGFRANFIVVDDPYARIEEAESATIREKVATWFIGDLGTRLMPGGKVFLVMTRFHEDDLTSTLMKMNSRLSERSQWLKVEVPGVCYEEEGDILGRKVGDMLWDVYDHTWAKEKQVELGFQRYSLVIQQNDSAASTESISGNFKYYSIPPHLTNEALRKALAEGHVDKRGRPKPNRRAYFRRIVLSVDTASKPTERADYTVIQTWGETFDRQYYLLNQKRVKVDFNAMIQEIETQARKDDVDAILVEDKGQGTAYIQNRGKTSFQKRLAPAPIVPIDPKGQSKEFRFDEVSPMIVEGSVWLPEEKVWINDFLKEVSQFPEGAHDDQVDAMTQALLYFKKSRARGGIRKIGSYG